MFLQSRLRVFHVLIGLHYSFYSKSGDWRRVYEEGLRQIALADRLGFYAVSVSEHHFTETGWCPNPFLPLAAAASITTRIMLSTGVRLLLLHGPVRVAEEAVVLDNLSSGRAVIGVGMGYRREEFEAFNSPYSGKAERMEEQLKTLDKLLRGEEVSIEAEWGRLRRVRITPPPIQRPRPPIWIASKVKAGVVRAARLGDAWLTDPITPIKKLRELAEAYWSSVNSGGRIILRRDGLASRREEVLRKAEEAMLASYRSDYYEWGHLLDDEGEPINPHEKSFDEVRDMILGRFIIGRPDEFMDTLARQMKALKADVAMIRMSFPGISGEEVEESIKCVAER